MATGRGDSDGLGAQEAKLSVTGILCGYRFAPVIGSLGHAGAGAPIRRFMVTVGRASRHFHTPPSRSETTLSQKSLLFPYFGLKLPEHVLDIRCGDCS